MKFIHTKPTAEKYSVRWDYYKYPGLYAPEFARKSPFASIPLNPEISEWLETNVPGYEYQSQESYGEIECEIKIPHPGYAEKVLIYLKEYSQKWVYEDRESMPYRLFYVTEDEALEEVLRFHEFQYQNRFYGDKFSKLPSYMIIRTDLLLQKKFKELVDTQSNEISFKVLGEHAEDKLTMFLTKNT